MPRMRVTTARPGARSTFHFHRVKEHWHDQTRYSARQSGTAPKGLVVPTVSLTYLSIGPWASFFALSSRRMVPTRPAGPDPAPVAWRRNRHHDPFPPVVLLPSQPLTPAATICPGCTSAPAASARQAASPRTEPSSRPCGGTPSNRSPPAHQSSDRSTPCP